MDTDKDKTQEFTREDIMRALHEHKSQLDRIEDALRAVKEREEKRLDVFRQVVLYALGLLGVKK